MRIKLQLGAVHASIHKAWFFIPPHIQTVDELRRAIVSRFDLAAQAIHLHLDGFALWDGPIDLVKEDEVLVVTPAHAQTGDAVQQTRLPQTTPISLPSVQQASYCPGAPAATSTQHGAMSASPMKSLFASADATGAAGSTKTIGMDTVSSSSDSSEPGSEPVKKTQRHAKTTNAKERPSAPQRVDTIAANDSPAAKKQRLNEPLPSVPVAASSSSSSAQVVLAKQLKTAACPQVSSESSSDSSDSSDSSSESSSSSAKHAVAPQPPAKPRAQSMLTAIEAKKDTPLSKQARRRQKNKQARLVSAEVQKPTFQTSAPVSYNWNLGGQTKRKCKMDWATVARRQGHSPVMNDSNTTFLKSINSHKKFDQDDNGEEEHQRPKGPSETIAAKYHQIQKAKAAAIEKARALVAKHKSQSEGTTPEQPPRKPEPAKDYSAHPLLTHTPSVGDILAYRTLVLRNMSPQPSSYKEAEVKEITPNATGYEVVLQRISPAYDSENEGMDEGEEEPSLVGTEVRLSSQDMLQVRLVKAANPAPEQASNSSTESVNPPAQAHEETRNANAPKPALTSSTASPSVEMSLPLMGEASEKKTPAMPPPPMQRKRMAKAPPQPSHDTYSRRGQQLMGTAAALACIRNRAAKVGAQNLATSKADADESKQEGTSTVEKETVLVEPPIVSEGNAAALESTPE